MTLAKIAISAALLITAATAVKSATFYSDRNIFGLETSPQIIETFNDVGAGSSFAGQELSVGNMTFGGGISPEPTVHLNYIAPGGTCVGVNFDLFETDGSPFACSYAGSHADLRVDFLAPVISWGADFTDLGDETRHTKFSFYDTDSNLISDFVASGYAHQEKRFFGFDLDGAEAGHMTMSFLVGSSGGFSYDAFGIDNVGFSTARGQDMPSPVPLPSSLFLMGVGGCCFVGLKRAKKKP